MYQGSPQKKEAREREGERGRREYVEEESRGREAE